MAVQPSRFNQILLGLLIALYLVSLGAYMYINWQVETEHNVWQMVGSAFLLSIPLVLFYGSIYVIVRAWREHRLTGEISPRLAGVVHWAPRIAAVVIILFAGLFSLDVFAMEGSPLELAVGFLIHNVPSILMIVMLVFAWRKPAVGFFAFLAAGVAFLYFVVFGGNLGNFLLFSGPLLLISALFYADWRWQRPQPGASPHPAV